MPTLWLWSCLSSDALEGLPEWSKHLRVNMFKSKLLTRPVDLTWSSFPLADAGALCREGSEPPHQVWSFGKLYRHHFSLYPNMTFPAFSPVTVQCKSLSLICWHATIFFYLSRRVSVQPLHAKSVLNTCQAMVLLHFKLVLPSTHLEWKLGPWTR